MPAQKAVRLALLAASVASAAPLLAQSAGTGAKPTDGGANPAAKSRRDRINQALMQATGRGVDAKGIRRVVKEYVRDRAPEVMPEDDIAATVAALAALPGDPKRANSREAQAARRMADVIGDDGGTTTAARLTNTAEQLQGQTALLTELAAKAASGTGGPGLVSVQFPDDVQGEVTKGKVVLSGFPMPTTNDARRQLGQMIMSDRRVMGVGVALMTVGGEWRVIGSAPDSMGGAEAAEGLAQVITDALKGSAGRKIRFADPSGMAQGNDARIEIIRVK